MAEETDQASQKIKTPDGAKTVPPKKKSGNRTLIIVLAVLFVLFVLPGIAIVLLFGWLSSGDNAGNLVESAIESSTGSEIDFDSSEGSLSIETDDGEKLDFQTGDGATIADDFPDDIPLYEKQSLVAATRFGDETTTVWSVQATTNDSRSEVLAFFDDRMKDWKQSFTSSTDGNDTRYYEKGDLRLQLSVSSDDESEIMIAYNVSRTTEQ